MFRIFKPVEAELKTKRTVDDVTKSLRTRASFDGDKFTINAKTLSLYRGSRVTGRIKRDEESTIVAVKIYPSADFKAGISLILISGSLVALTLLTLQIISHGLDPEMMKITAFSLLGLLAFWTVCYFIFRAMFAMSCHLQNESIKALVSEGI